MNSILTFGLCLLKSPTYIFVIANICFNFFLNCCFLSLSLCKRCSILCHWMWGSLKTADFFFFPYCDLHFLHEFLKCSFFLLHFMSLTRPCLRAESFILNSWHTEYSFNLQIFFLNFREIYFMSSKHLLVHLLVFLLQ